ncbi:MAG: putative metalloprotease with PDZ domain [Bacteroidia bacterium]|jgi:predicted metalloprotease with PDZ domain
MTLNESSKLAWVKAYLSNENSNNVTISYYNKGMLVSWMLDMEIMTNTNGVKRLDDVMRSLYKSYYVDKQRGFTYAEFVEACSGVCRKSLEQFFNTYIKTTENIPYSKYLDLTGFKLQDTPDAKPSLGIKTKNDNGKCIVSYIKPSGPAAIAGLSVNDELIALNGWRINSDINTDIGGFEIGAKLNLQYARDGKMQSTNIIPTANDQVNYTVVPSESISKEQEKLRKLWLD